MKSLFLILVFTASNAFAAKKIDAKAVLGTYLNTDSGGQFSEIEIKYDLDNKLVLAFDDSEDSTFALDTVGADGLIVDSDVFDDCDDPGCGSWSYVKVKIDLKGSVPKLTVDFTLTYNFPEEPGDREGDVTHTEEFIWSAPLVSNDPVLLNAKIPGALQKALDTCSAAVRASHIPVKAVCPSAQVYSYKNSPDFDSAWAALADVKNGVAQTEVSFEKLEITLYARIEATLLGMEIVKAVGSSTNYTAMLNGVQQVKDYVKANADVIFISTWLDSSTVYVVNDSKKTIIVLEYSSF